MDFINDGFEQEIRLIAPELSDDQISRIKNLHLNLKAIARDDGYDTGYDTASEVLRESIGACGGCKNC